MPPYKFRLETVRRLRQARRDELRGQLADAYHAVERLDEERRRIKGELAALRDKMAADVRSPDFDVNRQLGAQRYEMVLKAQLHDLDEKRRLVEQEAERRREAVVAGERDVKALDALDRRGRDRHLAEAARAEQQAADETAGVLWGRQAATNE